MNLVRLLFAYLMKIRKSEIYYFYFIYSYQININYLISYTKYQQYQQLNILFLIYYINNYILNREKKWATHKVTKSSKTSKKPNKKHNHKN
jgi:hypothetical protein